MNVRQSAIPILIVAAPLLVAFILPVLGWWKRTAVFPVTLAALAAAFGLSIATARAVLARGPSTTTWAAGSHRGESRFASTTSAR